MTQLFGGAGKLAILGLAVTAALMLPLSASARGWGGHADYGHRGGYSGAYYGHGYDRGYSHGYDRGYGRGYGYGHGGGHWSGGRWIAGALVAGAVVGLIDSVTRPAPVYYEPQVVYSQPRTVVYDSYGPPVVERRVVERRTVIYQDDPYATRYIRSDDDRD